MKNFGHPALDMLKGVEIFMIGTFLAGGGIFSGETFTTLKGLREDFPLCLLLYNIL